MSEDKRKYLRFECLVPVEDIKIADADMRAKAASLVDVSRDGLHIVVDMDYGLTPGTKVDFDLNIPDKRSDSRVSGEVMWARPKDGRVEVGIKIIRMSPATKSELLDMGYLHWQDERRKSLENK